MELEELGVSLDGTDSVDLNTINRKFSKLKLIFNPLKQEQDKKNLLPESAYIKVLPETLIRLTKLDLSFKPKDALFEQN